MRSAWLFLLVAVAAVTAEAASVVPPAQRADPTDPKSASAPLTFDTGLASTLPLANVDPPARWREHNERVRVIGGHAGYLRAGTPATAEPKNGNADKAGLR
jgi:hypothetical protein